MKSAADPNRMTRVQVQEKLKRNFQALCAKCPQLANNYDVLDDSLTSLHWLSNLNVNLNNPMKEAGKNGVNQQNQGFLPSFPHAAMRNSPLHPPTDVPQNFPAKGTYARRNWNASPVKQKSGGSRKSSAKTGRNASAPTMGRPSPPLATQDNGERMHSAAVASSKMLVRGLPINPPLARPLPPTNGIESGPANLTSSTWGYDVADVKINGPQVVTRNLVDTAHLPQILKATASNQKIIGITEPTPSVTSPTSHYTFSPREVMLDILPGQVDYKNNPYEKPNFSYTTLICMALQTKKKHKMSYSSICKWISDNFMYYRYAETGWQNSVKLNLTQGKYFSKVSKKDSTSKSYLWEINPASNIKLRDSNSSLLLGNIRKTDPRLGPVQISPASSLSLPSVCILPKFDYDESPVYFKNRKRKQTTPQKAVRRRNGSAKKRRNNTKSAGNRNLLQEEAPELGSLKGDFNWNTIFDEFFGTAEGALSVTPTSMASRPSTNESRGTAGQSTEDLTSAAMLSLDLLSLPDLPEPSSSGDENMTSSNTTSQTQTVPVSSWQIYNENTRNQSKIENNTFNEIQDPASISDLPLLEECDLLFPDSINDSDSDLLAGFLKNAEALDLTVTGTQIAPPEDWIPVSADLEAILCETQNDEIQSSSSVDVDSLLSTPSPPLDNPDQYLSSVVADKKRKKKNKKSDLGFNNKNDVTETPKAITKRPTNWSQTYFTKVH